MTLTRIDYVRYCCITLAGACGSEAVAEFKDQLHAAMAEKKPILVDMESVTSIAAGFLRALDDIVAECSLQHIRLVLCSVSACLMSQLTVLGHEKAYETLPTAIDAAGIL